MELNLAIAFLVAALWLAPKTLVDNHKLARRQLWSHAVIVVAAGLLCLATLRATTALRAVSSDFELVAMYVAMIVLVVVAVVLPRRRSVGAIKLLRAHQSVS